MSEPFIAKVLIACLKAYQCSSFDVDPKEELENLLTRASLPKQETPTNNIISDSDDDDSV